MPHTHVGFRRKVGYVHGAKLYGHKSYGGKRHALNGPELPHSGAVYKALCGKEIVADHDGEQFNVWRPAKCYGPGAGVTCKRCRALIGPTSKPCETIQP